MYKKSIRISFLACALAAATFAVAGDDPGHERHELMEGVRDAAKPVGAMLKGEADYDLAVVMTSLETFASAADQLGGLFPEGSEGGEAAPAIWEDREGFEAAIVEWQQVTAAAIEANPATLGDAKPVLGPVFGSCKNCHDTYRIEE